MTSPDSSDRPSFGNTSPFGDTPLQGAGLILAGGLSRRMGHHKALLPVAGTTFLGLVLERMRGLGLAQIYVVCCPDLVKRLSLPVDVCLCMNPHPESGPIGSLQVGLRAGAGERAWVMVALVDHPVVAADTYVRLAYAARSTVADMWVPSYDGRRGHPVVFARCMYEDLLQVPPGEGARWAVARHRSQRYEVPVVDAEVVRNVDTPEEYSRLLEAYGE